MGNDWKSARSEAEMRKAGEEIMRKAAKEKKDNDPEKKMIEAAQEYALRVCVDDVGCLTKVKIAFEEGFKYSQK